MNLDNQIGQEKLESKQKQFDDAKKTNSKLEKEIEDLDQNVSDFSTRLTREEANRVQFQDEVTILYYGLIEYNF